MSPSKASTATATVGRSPPRISPSSAASLRTLVERAFEAGIEYVLGEEAAHDAPETKEEGEFSGKLLQTMLENSDKVKELVKGDALDRTVIDTLITHAAKQAVS